MSADSKIAVRDIVKHQTRGDGIVIEVNYEKKIRYKLNGKTQYGIGAVKVYFNSLQTEKVLPIEWVVKNCIIVRKNHNDHSAADKEKDTDAKVIREINEANSIEKIMKSFNSFSLPPFALKEIETLFWFKINYAKGHKRSLRYNLLVQCDKDDEAVRFINAVQNSLKELDMLPKKTGITKEKDFNDEMNSLSNYSMLALHDCVALQKDSVAVLSSIKRSDLQKNWENKIKFWHNVKKLSDTNKECLLIAAGPRGFVDFVKDNDDIFSDFFTHRIFLEPKILTVAELVDKVLKSLAEEGLKTNKKFDAEIQRYIECVYPTSELKGDVFINSLLDSILVAYYATPTGKTVTEQCVPFYIKPKSYDDIAEKLNALVGLDRVKEEFKKLHTLSKNKGAKSRMRLHFAFVGNPGTGKTTVANLTAELLYSMGLIKKNKIVVVSQTDIISIYAGESAQRMREKIEEAKGGILFIDEAYFLVSQAGESTRQQQSLETLMVAMENNASDLSVIFAGYEKEIDTLLNSNPGLASRVPYRFVFDDYTDNELMQIFLNLVAEEELTLGKDAYDTLLDRISIARSDENFGNARTVANLFQQVTAVRLNKPKDQDIITKADILATMPVSKAVDLNQMIGLDTIKQELAAFESRVKYIKYLREKNISVPAPNLHMLFLGNPGTGKTTVAKKIADCLYQIGVLKKNNLVIAERKTLVDEHIGGTAIKTGKLIQKALNGVLFVDEAYSLAPKDSGKDFGREAIETLITAMEEHKDRLVVIFAGYRKEMSRFLQSNAGISSRIGFKFYFPDYSTEELTEMFKRKLQSSGFVISDEALESVKKLMDYFSKVENFGNGRFVDRIIDSTINKRSLRTYGTKFNDIEKCDVPRVSDIARVMTEELGFTPEIEKSDTFKKRIAVHEIGHAIVGFTLQPQRVINTVSVDEDASSLGRVAIQKAQDEAYTESYLKGVLASLFGGRNAERIVFGEHSAGCRNDMARAKELAEQMINELAVGELGVTSALDLLKEADKTTTEILLKHKETIMVLADRLMKKGSIKGTEFEKMLRQNK